MKQWNICLSSLFASLLFSTHAFLFAQAPQPYGALPSQRQLQWQETDMYCIIHFSMATYTMERRLSFGH